MVYEKDTQKIVAVVVTGVTESQTAVSKDPQFTDRLEKAE